jgi:hypothetical protein
MERPEEAMWAFRALNKLQPNVDIAAIMLLLAQDQNEEFPQRDKTIKSFPAGSPFAWLPKLIGGAVAGGEKQKIDLDAADKHIAGMPEPQQAAATYFVGRFLEPHGHKADALRYYRRWCEPSNTVSHVFTTLATVRARALGAKVSPAPNEHKLFSG